MQKFTFNKASNKSLSEVINEIAALLHQQLNYDELPDTPSVLLKAQKVLT